jgi:hypothetical protein
MVRAENSTVVWDEISTDTAAESASISSLSSNRTTVYILKNPLSAATTDGGGPSVDYRGVFQDQVALDLLEAAANLGSLGLASGRAYILGASGRAIAGYSDDATLIAQGYVTAAAIAAQRLALTANRILVSLPVGQSPTAHTYAVIYIVGADSGSKDIDPGPTQYVTLGSLTLTYDEDR